MAINRRKFLTSSSALAGAAALTACGNQSAPTNMAADCSKESGEAVSWKMVTSWPANFPGLGTGANTLAQYINAMSGGRLQVTVYGGGELVPAFEVFDAVSRGTAQMGHSAAYYWKGKIPAAQFFGAVPFGMNAQEMNGWLTYGGGQELWEELYEPFGVLPLAAGNSGAQMGGWFNKEIRSIEDLKGLRMRIPGLGGEVLDRAGGTPVNLPGAEIFTSLQTGSIDATEWVGPSNDLAFGLFRAAKYYYTPGWHEPCANIEALINKQAFAALDSDLQAIVRHACKAAAQDMLDEFTARNHTAFNALLTEHNVQMRTFPDSVLKLLRQYADDVVQELGQTNALAGRIYDSYQQFLSQAARYHDLTEAGFYRARSL